jgi:hypothetical protein
VSRVELGSGWAAQTARSDPLQRSKIAFMADRARALEDVLALSVADRASVTHELLRSLDGEDADAAAAWTDGIGRRTDEIEAGTAELHGLDTVRARLQAASRA